MSSSSGMFFSGSESSTGSKKCFVLGKTRAWRDGEVRKQVLQLLWARLFELVE
jgi:hypothetical protein|tara:strand:- start:27 stop:185 length:159 start_codon:yes stop_codon:yes gene_type:complete